jgi:surfeit locus 1 family protein
MPVEAKRLRTILWPGISATIALAILASLGTWQLQRLAWKEDLIGRIKSRAHSEPAPLPPREEWAKMASGDYEYFPVRVAGVFEHAREALVFRPAGGAEKQPGYHVMTPLELKGSGGTIFINRGFVPEALKAPSARPLGQVAGEVIVKGLLRAPEPRSMFTPGDQPTQGLWYTRDPAAMAKHFGIEHAAPFSIDADATPQPGGWPKGGATVVSIRNDHLAYAVTWYGIAATLVGVFGVFAWRRLSA